MGRVTDYLTQLIARQLDENRLVVWFDPDRFYEAFTRSLGAPSAMITCYDGSFFELRHRIEPQLQGDQPPRLLVYVPLEEEATAHALAEVTATASILKPGAASLPQNTRPSVIARQALRNSLGAERASELAKQVDDGKLSLADLDRLDQTDGGSAVLRLVFGTTAPSEVALRFLTDPALDTTIELRGAIDEVTSLFVKEFGIIDSKDSGLDNLRQRVARHILVNEFLASLHGVPQALANVPLAPGLAQRENCAVVARQWRSTRNLTDSYTDAASHAQSTLQLARISFTLDQVRESHTFEAVEGTLQGQVEHALASETAVASIRELGTLAERRLGGFWAAQRAAIGDRWRLIQTAADLLLAAQRVEAELKHVAGTPEALMRAYAYGVKDSVPWCLLDTHFRNLERVWHTLDVDLSSDASLDRLMKHARHSYMRVGGGLAESFTGALGRARFRAAEIARQRDVYSKFVKPARAQGKTAYVLVDAFRFEMARELSISLGDEFKTSLDMAVGTAPGITSIGMAALMPDAEQDDVAMVALGNGALALRIGGVVLKDRDARVAWFKHRASEPVVETTLERMLPKPGSALKKELESANMALITSQEIDQAAESTNTRTARDVMDSALRDLARLVRILRSLQYKNIILTADHGHLFGEELDDSMKLDPPGGETVSLHRRVWIGRGGAAAENVMRVNLAQFGLQSDLELASPIGFGAFKMPGGARAYFHGGLSLPELTIPVLVLNASDAVGAVSTELAVELVSKKLTTGIYSVRVTGVWTGIFRPETQRVRVELRQGKEALTEIYDATYGLDRSTQEVELRASAPDPVQIEPNYVTLRLTAKTPNITSKTVSLVVLDAATSVELARIERIDVALYV